MNILITGASGDIGRVILETLADKHSFFLHAHSKDKIKDLRDFVKKNKINCKIFTADLKKTSDLEELCRKLKSAKVDAIIHCVSLPTVNKSIVEKNWGDFQSHLNVQTRSLFLLTQACIPHMQENHFGRIIAISSEYSMGRPPNKLSDYIVSKYALVALVKCLATELGSFGISCNCVSPGMSETALTAHLPKKLKEIVASQTPVGRLTKPSDIASLVEFLLSPQAQMINGENILINGGFTMR